MKFYPDRDTGFQLDQLLNRGLTLHDNHEGRVVEKTLQAGENVIQHNLGFRPIGWIELFKNADAEIWAVRETEWTTQRLYLESSAGNLKVRLFVL